MLSVQNSRGNPCNIVRRMEHFDQHLGLPTKSDTALVAFADSVREALAADRLPLPEAPDLVVAEEFAPDVAKSNHPDAGSFLAAAREHFKKDRLRQANLCLCYAAIVNDVGTGEGEGRDACAGNRPDPLIALEIWTLRASIARKCGRYDRAEFFLRQAFTCGASVQAHTELANVMLNTGRVEESKRLVALVRGFNTL